MLRQTCWIRDHSSTPAARDLSQLKCGYRLADFGNTVASSHVYVERMGLDFLLGLLPYGSRWRFQRRTFHQPFQPSVVDKYRGVELQQIRSFMPWVLDSPSQTRQYVRQSVYIRSTVNVVC